MAEVDPRQDVARAGRGPGDVAGDAPDAPRAWRAVHLTSYGTVWLVSVHAGLAGSDAINPVYRAVALVLVVAATGAGVTRLLARRLRSTGEFAAVIGPPTALDFAQRQLAVAPDLIAAATERDAGAAADEARVAAAAEGGSPADRDAAATAAGAALRAERLQALTAETARLGAAGAQSLDNPAFVDFLIFGPDGTIRPAMRYNYLDNHHGLLLAWLPGNAPIDEQAQGADLVDRVVARHPIPGVQVLASGPRCCWPRSTTTCAGAWRSSALSPGA